VKIAKTKDEEIVIDKFVMAMKEALNDNLYQTMAPMNFVNSDLQKMFDTVKDDLFVASGSLYLCFTCGSHMPRKDVPLQKFYQISGVWHSCMGSDNGYVIPTIGIITRWKMVAKYIEKLSILS